MKVIKLNKKKNRQNYIGGIFILFPLISELKFTF